MKYKVTGQQKSRLFLEKSIFAGHLYSAAQLPQNIVGDNRIYATFI